MYQTASYQSDDIVGVQRQADDTDKNLLLQRQITRMLALHILISRSRESSIPSRGFPRAHLYLLAIGQERYDTVTRHIFHFQTLNLFHSMSLVSMPSLPAGHSFPITSAINRISDDPPKVISSLCVDTSRIARLAIHMGLLRIAPSLLCTPRHPH